MKTKDKIMKIATKRFNESGYSAVTLFELAQTLGISRGNLTYHFKQKEEILEAITDQVFEQMEKERVKSRNFPSFENLHNEVQLIYKFQQEYKFIFFDQLILNHEIVKPRLQEMTKTRIQDNKSIIAFSIKLGNMKKEAIPGIYHNIAIITWMITFYWYPQQILRGDVTGNEGEKMIWSMLLPHFTEKGIKAFITYFGLEFYENIGEPFEMDIGLF